MLREPFRKALLSVAVTALVAGPLTACGSGDGSSDNASEESSPAPAPPDCPAQQEAQEQEEAAATEGLPDFDGDGHADLVVPAPKATVDGVEVAGAVSVIPGSADGPDTAHPQVISRATDGPVGQLAAGGTGFGAPAAVGDLDGDGFSDLAVARSEEGAYHSVTVVLWGSADGLTSGALLNGGNGLRTGDFDGDGHADLLLGNFFEADEEGDGEGLTVLYGPLDREGQTDRRDSFGGGMNFGDSNEPQHMIVGDLNGDGADDLVTSQAFEEMQHHGRFYPGGPDGLSQEYEDLDTFSANGVVADVNGDGCGDLVVRDVTEVSEMSHEQEGEVRVLLGSASGPGKSGEPITLETVGQQGDTGDEFGSALRAADVNGDGFEDVVVGTPGERSGAGIVTLIPGGPDGLSGEGATTWGEGLAEIPGEEESGDRFGTAVWLGDVDGDDLPELAVGAPGQHDGDAVVGAVWVLGDPAAGAEDPAALDAVSFGPADLGAPTDGVDPEWDGVGGTGFGSAFGR